MKRNKTTEQARQANRRARAMRALKQWANDFLYLGDIGSTREILAEVKARAESYDCLSVGAWEAVGAPEKEIWRLTTGGAGETCLYYSGLSEEFHIYANMGGND